MTKRCIVALLFVLALHAQTSPTSYLNGKVGLGNGQGVNGGTVNLQLSQAAYVAGSFAAAPQSFSCYLATNGPSSSLSLQAGQIVGVPDPQGTLTTTPNYSSGSLPAGTYYIKWSYGGSFAGPHVPGAIGRSNSSTEFTFLMTSPGTLTITSPSVRPPASTGWYVYVASTSGQEYLQGSLTALGTNISISTALAVGPAPPGSFVFNPPVSNNTTCFFWFNDSLIPTYTTYQMNVVDSAGRQVRGFPQSYYFQGSTNDISNMTPSGNLSAKFPSAIVANPSAGANQSINGGLTVAGLLTTQGGISVGGPISATTLNLSQMGSTIGNSAVSSTTVGLVMDNMFTNPDLTTQIESRMLTAINRRIQTHYAEGSADQFGIAGVATIEPGTTSGTILGQMKPVVSEIYLFAPTTGAYIVNQGINYLATVPALATGTTLSHYYGFFGSAPCRTGGGGCSQVGLSGGTITEGYNFYAEGVPSSVVSGTRAAFRSNAQGNDGRFMWTQNDLQEATDSNNIIVTIGAGGPFQVGKTGEAAQLRLPYQSTTPNITGFAIGAVYARSSDKHLLYQDDAGTITDLSAAGGGGGGGWTVGTSASTGTNSLGATGFLGSSTNFDIAFGTNATERMRISNGGLVAIGTTSPLSLTQLTVNGGASNYAIAVDAPVSSYMRWHVANAALASIYATATDWNFGTVGAVPIKVSTNGTEAFKVDGTTQILTFDKATDYKGVAAPAVSPAGSGRIYFDSGTNTFLCSQNGAAYAACLGGTTATWGIGTAAATGTNTLGATAYLGAKDAFAINFVTDATANGAVSLHIDTSKGANGNPFGTMVSIGTITPAGANTQLTVDGGASNTVLSLNSSGADTFMAFRNGGTIKGVIDARAASWDLYTQGAIPMTLSTNGSQAIGISTAQLVTFNKATIYSGITTPGVSAAGTGRQYFDSGTNTFRCSENAGAYVNCVGGSVSGWAVGTGPNTGVNAPGATAYLGTTTADGSALGISPAGIEAMHFLANQKIGVNTTTSFGAVTQFTVNTPTGAANRGLAVITPNVAGNLATLTMAQGGTARGLLLDNGFDFSITTAANAAANMIFATNAGSSEALRINPSQQVLVGETTPFSALTLAEISTSATNKYDLLLNIPSGSAAAQLVLSYNGGGQGAIQTSSVGTILTDTRQAQLCVSSTTCLTAKVNGTATLPTIDILFPPSSPVAGDIAMCTNCQNAAQDSILAGSVCVWSNAAHRAQTYHNGSNWVCW